MKRLGIILWIFLFLLAVISRTGSAANVQGTKHDLSTTGPGPIRADVSSVVSEVCVFCHTPHGAAAISGAPLWNKHLNAPTYTMYTSDVLNALTYPPAEQPLAAGKAVHVRKTRLCLTCHDGTIALGQLANLPSPLSSDIPMAGTAGTTDVLYAMPHEAAGYIGFNLEDDHPVAIPYIKGNPPGGDPELNVSPSTPLARVKVFSDGVSTNYVECTSCHEPHDAQYGNFLVEPNSGSAICIGCHVKTGFATSIHETSAVPYQPPDGAGPQPDIGVNVGGVKCMNCHFPHKAGVTTAAPTTPNPPSGKYLLSFQESSSCYNTTNRWGQATTACHGSGSAKNIQGELLKASGHHVENASYLGQHRATEERNPATGQALYNWVSPLSKWHVQCADCHNPHTGGNVLHTPGAITNTIASNSPLKGAGGVGVSVYPPWPDPSTGTYTYIEPEGALTAAATALQYEYQICFKCHSDFAWGLGAKPTTQTLTTLTNQAMEFNPGSNAGYHSVVQLNLNRFQPPAASWLGGWGATSLMYCSDCHGNNAVSPAGPHGSSNAMILKKVYGNAVVLSTDTTFLCFDCHNGNTYGRNGTGAANTTGFSDGTQNLHTLHATTYDQPCKGCHVAIPHGYQSPTGRIVANRGLLLTEGTAEPAPYRGAVITNGGGLGTANNMWLYVITLKASGAWTAGDCTWNVSTNGH